MLLFHTINDSSQVRMLVLRYAYNLIQMVVVLMLLTCCASVSQAQETSKPKTSPTIEEKSPPAYWLPVNGDGEYKRVGGIQYEEFAKWWIDRLKSETELPTDLPGINYLDLKSDAHVEGSTVIINVIMELKPLNQGWIQVPLGFRDAILKDRPTLDSAIENRLDFDNADIGYSCWLNIETEEQVGKTISLSYSVIAQVSKSSDTFSVDLHYPTAFSCELDFQLEKENPWIETSTHAISHEIVFNDQTSSKRIQFAGETLQLRWGFQEEALMMDSPELRVSGSTIMVTVHDENHVSTEAKLRVESINGLLKSFDVRIADNATLVSRSEENAAYTIRKVTSVIDEKQVEILRVEVVDPTLRSIDIELNTNQQPSKSQNGGSERFEIGLFNVQGSKIQDGEILLKYNENVTVSWDDPSESQVEPGVEHYGEVEAAFHYPSQPSGLSIRVKPSRTSLLVQPAYRLMLGKEEAQLEARFLFSMPVGFDDDLKFDIADWQVEEIGPLESTNRWSREVEDGVLTLSLMEPDAADNAPALGGRVEEIVIKARRLLDIDDSIETSAQSIKLPWIVPSADLVEVAAVEVDTEFSILVTPLQSLMPAFRVDRLQNTGSEETADTSYFRLIPQTETPFFVFELEQLRPLITIESQVKLNLRKTDSQNEVIQTFQFNVFHRQLAELAFYHFLDASQVNRLTAFVDGKEVALLPNTLEQEVDTQVQSFRLPITSASGMVEVQLRYSIGVTPNNSGPYPLRLISPKIDTTESSTGFDVIYRPMKVELEVPSDLNVALIDEEKNPIAASASASQLVQEYVFDHFKDQLELKYSESKPTLPGEIQIQHSWLQAVYGNNERRDRVCFLLKTNRPEIQLKLPRGIRKIIEVRWDQVAITDRFLNLENPGTPSVRIPTGSSEVETVHVLELWYDLRLGNAGVERDTIALPEILESVQINKTYLQIATPENWVCLGTTEWSNEMQWNWSGLRLERTLEKNQADLEQLLNASEQDAVSNMPGLEVYLFSKIGTSEAASLFFVRRSHLFLCFSGTSLLVGLVFFYLPATRKTWLLWTLSVGLFCSGLVYPTYTLLAGQLASLGVALALLSMVLSVVLQWMKPKRAVIRGIASDSHHSTEFLKEEEHVSNHSTATMLDPSSPSLPQPKGE